MVAAVNLFPKQIQHGQAESVEKQDDGRLIDSRSRECPLSTQSGHEQRLL
jgi:hypothetical protein